MTDPKTGSHAGEGRAYAAAVRFVAAVAVAALAVLGLALWWLSTCRTDSATDPLAHCSAVQRNLLAIGPSLVLFAGGVAGFVRTYRLWRSGAGNWWVWQGAGWFLLVLMLVVLTMAVPPALG
ncbi:hypothetical protein LV457_05185 [Mycobacterium sp. MYCO198283]|uniref:hypothetical protein n=1 Tax=Mycobacterium sp. MYCO198283 TaxID=2883505 RepID=UPI001E292842|nr:hypothetical protein [Mycobacterium sp. MYCO198283]MCG5431686.1 hypothetical protein [Mycobacterium sp. MYCO198283]